MEKIRQRFYYDKATFLKIFVCFLILGIFWVIPPIEPITKIEMRVIGSFISAVLLLSIVDTVWPVFFTFLTLVMSGVMDLNQILAGSLGNWIFTFVVTSFIMTIALNEVGFTSRLTTYYMSRKFVNNSPWTFTFAFYTIAMLIGMFMDQAAVAAFFIPFTIAILRKLGYDKNDKYSHVLLMGVVFAINIGGAATPISHSLALLGLGIYEQATGQAVNLLTYMIYGIPVAIVLMIIMCLVIRFIIKPDVSKLQNLEIDKILEKTEPMDLKEKVTAIIFFTTVFFWVFPGFLMLFLSKGHPLIQIFSKFPLTFWSLLAVVLFSVIRINNEPIMNLKVTIENKFSWGIIFFISIGVLLGSAVSNPKVGLSEFVILKLKPILDTASSLTVVLLFAFITILLTNFASNVTTITVMTGVAVTVAMANSNLSIEGLVLTTTMCGSLAYVLPSSFATIAMLHSDEYSNSKMVIKYGSLMVFISTVVTTFIGYQIVSLFA